MPISIIDDYRPGTARGNTCYICGSGRRQIRDADGTLRAELVADLQQTIDFEGFLMVCETCLREGARMLGMVDDPDAPRLREQVAALEQRLAAVTAERDEAHQLVELIRGFDDKHPRVQTSAEFTPEPKPQPHPRPKTGARR